MVQRQNVRKNLREQVLSELGQAILHGELAPGDTLPNEADLGDEFGVSRTVIREAIKGLAARGLVESRSRVGTTVRQEAHWKLLDADVLSWALQSSYSTRVLWEITEVRLAVEPAAARWAAERATPREKRRIEQCFMALEAAVGDRTPWIEADLAFHDSILTACGNELLVSLVDTLRSALQESREATVLMMKQIEAEGEQAEQAAAGYRYAQATRQALELHRTPFEAIMDGDGKRAEEGMRTVIRWVMTVLDSQADMASTAHMP